MKTSRPVRCVSNAGYPVCLRQGKVYTALPDKFAERHGMIRVIDESGEDCLFSASRFVPIADRQSRRRS